MDRFLPRVLFFALLLQVSPALKETASAFLPFGPNTRSTAAESAPEDAGASFQAARSLDAAGSRAEALRQYRAVSKSHQFTPEGSNAQFRLAQIFEEAGELEKAFNEYSTFIKLYPDSKWFDQAIASQIKIANTYLDGKRVKFLGLPVSSGLDRASKMYEGILANAPFSPFAPMAQFNLGLSYEKQGKVQEAVRAYQALLDRYPASNLADDALYQMAYINMRAGFAGGSEDLSALILSKNTFEDFLFQFPDSEKVPQAEENLKKIAAREGGDLLQIARFYDRQRDYRAAFIYYNDVIRRSPSGQDAEIATIRINELRNDFGDDALRTGPERAETGEKVALRRRLQAQVETSELADFAGPSRAELDREELPVVRPRLRTNLRDVEPLPATDLPPVEPELPVQ